MSLSKHWMAGAASFDKLRMTKGAIVVAIVMLSLSKHELVEALDGRRGVLRQAQDDKAGPLLLPLSC
jgi:hypothetical protein